MFFLKSLTPGQADKIHLFLVGDMDEEILNFLNENEQISYTHEAFIERYELIPWYLACDFMALPSFYDGMPNVLIEGAALKRPFIASTAGGMSDFLDNTGAFLFSPGDTKGCTRALAQAIEINKLDREKMGEHNFSLIEKTFNAENEIAKHIELIESIEEELT